MSDLDDFKRTERPKGKKSRLDPYAREIFDLRRDGYSLDQIRQYLIDKKGCQIARQNLHLWIKRHGKEGSETAEPAKQAAQLPASPDLIPSPLVTRPDRPRLTAQVEAVKGNQLPGFPATETGKTYSETVREMRQREKQSTLAAKLKNVKGVDGTTSAPRNGSSDNLTTNSSCSTQGGCHEGSGD